MERINRIFKMLLIAIVLFQSNKIFSSEKDSSCVSASLGADVVSRYVWRGILTNNAVNVQPTMGLAIGNFCVGSWASYSVSQSFLQEVDLYVTYSIGSFTVGVNDYFAPVDSFGAENHYFDMGKKTTPHIFEPFVTWEEIGGLPISLTAAVFAYGNDRDALDKNFYSSYFELGYSRNIGEVGFTAFAGGTFKEGYYAGKAALVNVGCGLSKELKITDSFSIPVKGSLIINPDTENAFFVFSMTF